MTTRQRQPWTLERHKIAAKQLFDARNALGTMTVDLGHSYSVNSKALVLACKAQRLLDDLRDQLDDLLADEQREHFSPSIYYPGAAD